MHEVLVNHLGGLILPRKSVVRLTDCPHMTLDVYHGRKTTMLQQQQQYTTAFVLFPKIFTLKCVCCYKKYIFRTVVVKKKFAVVMSAIIKWVDFSYVLLVYVMGKALTDELSCTGTCLVYFCFIFSRKFLYVFGENLDQPPLSVIFELSLTVLAYVPEIEYKVQWG